MKLNLEQSDQYKEIEVTIKYSTTDAYLERLISQIRLYGYAVQGKTEDATILVRAGDIFYFESIEGKTFIYGEKDVYRCDLRLYEIEQQFCNGLFVRISKSNILNVEKLKSFRAKLNGKLEAKLINGECLEIKRHYVADLKKCLREMEGIR